MRQLLALTILTAASTASFAEEVYTFIKGQPVKGAQKPYLSTDSWINEGYLSVRATFSAAQGADCITPSGAQGISSFFWKRDSEVVIAARLWGFKGIPSDKWFPLATYLWNNENKFCRTFFQPTIVLVPSVPLVPSRVANTPGDQPDQPFIVVSVRSTSKDEEKISTAATTLLQIGSAYATGGASQTVSGLIDIAGGPVVKLIGKQVNEAFKSGAELAFEVPLSWSEIVSGTSRIPFELISVERNRWQAESVEEAIARGKNRADQRRSLMRMNLVFDIRRSVFFTDEEAKAAPYVLDPTKPSMQSLAVLNFPRNAPDVFQGGLASVNQMLSGDLPALAQRLKQPDYAAQCATFISKVVGSGFNGIDTALVVASAFNEALNVNGIETWNRDPLWLRDCLPDKDLLEKMRKVTRPNYVSFPGPSTEVEQGTYQEDFIEASHRSFLNEMRRALLQRGSARQYDLRNLLKELPDTVNWPSSMSDLVISPEPMRVAAPPAVVAAAPPTPTIGDTGAPMAVVAPAVAPTLSRAPVPPVGRPTPLEEIKFVKVGCLMSYRTDDGRAALAMAFLAELPNDAVKPVVLVFTLDSARLKEVPVAKAIVGIFTFTQSSLDERAMINILNWGKFVPGSTCHNTDPTKLPLGLTKR